MGAADVDIVIRGGTVYDGTGSAPVRADITVAGGRITAVVPRAPDAPPTPTPTPTPTPSPSGARVLDATNLAVAPGFIDLHTHSDLSVLLDGRAQSKVRQGVTTEVIGNCGFSAFPVAPGRRRELVELLAGIGDDPIDPWWNDLDGYAGAAQEVGLALNLAPLVGHGALRIAVMGLASRAPTRAELAELCALLDHLLDQGAFGLSTGLTYVPSRYADTAELEALGRTLAKRDRLYATHSRGDLPDPYASLDEAAALGRATGVAVQYSHAAINDPGRWGTAAALVERFDAARREGVDICYDVYPYDGSASALTQYLPAWVLDGGVEAMRVRLADPTTFRRAETDVAAGWGERPIAWFWDRVLLARTDRVCDAVEGQTIEEAARAAGRSPAAFVLDLCREGGNRVQVVMFYRTEDDMRTFLRHDHALVGSDGAAIPYQQGGRRPHPRAFGAHTRVLGRYVRDVGDLDLATAVHRMTGAVAARLNLADRGTIATGKAADVVVFDPATVADRGTYLDPCQPPVGIRHVLVNGQLVVDGDQNGTAQDGDPQTGARPGRVLRAGG